MPPFLIKELLEQVDLIEALAEWDHADEDQAPERQPSEAPSPLSRAFGEANEADEEAIRVARRLH